MVHDCRPLLLDTLNKYCYQVPQELICSPSLQPVLEHQKLKVCLEDAKRRSYHSWNIAPINPRSWKELSKS
ncbi:hypothetical protein P5673_024446 [Acropora cervicornis]|uniref:Uncharacterized protein n=1 Tax=Acropora cervicornis TaxID=6130 RepID=A0AAD9Q3I6_ACRCE|nr:hypothetical protein P5673_024446 [Acropora cervicornis]